MLELNFRLEVLILTRTSRQSLYSSSAGFDSLEIRRFPFLDNVFHYQLACGWMTFTGCGRTISSVTPHNPSCKPFFFHNCEVFNVLWCSRAPSVKYITIISNKAYEIPCDALQEATNVLPCKCLNSFRLLESSFTDGLAVALTFPRIPLDYAGGCEGKQALREAASRTIKESSSNAELIINSILGSSRPAESQID